MTNERLDYILAIAEEKNITRAARRLYISQPALTLYLNRLESDLEVKLFDRTKSPIELTEAGKYYIDKMKKIYAQEQLLRNDILAIANPKHSLSIGIGQVRGQHWLPLLLPTFCSIHPQVNVQIIQTTEQTMTDQLLQHRLDLAIGVLPSSVTSLQCVDLMYESLFIVAHKKYGLIPSAIRSQYNDEHPYQITSQQLNHLPFIIPQVNNGMYDSYKKLILDNQIRPSRTISISNLNTGLRLSCAGLGVQLLSGSILQMRANAFTDINDIDFCILEHMPEKRKCVAAYHTDTIKQGLISDIVRIVRDEVLPQCEHIIPIFDTGE